jgi:hypothetical protein
MNVFLELSALAPHRKDGRERGGKGMKRIKKIIIISLLAWAFIFPLVLCPGEEKRESLNKKEVAEKSVSEKKTGKVNEDWQKVKKDAQEAGREFKESGKQLADAAKKGSKKTGEALKKGGNEFKEGLKETFRGLKKLFKG